MANPTSKEAAECHSLQKILKTLQPQPGQDVKRRNETRPGEYPQESNHMPSKRSMSTASQQHIKANQVLAHRKSDGMAAWNSTDIRQASTLKMRQLKGR